LITAWRIAKQNRAGEAFSGEGAYRYGGRWNHRGTRVVYISDSLALAVLEQFVHLGRAAIRLRFVSFRVEVPDRVAMEVFDRGHLPKDWRAEPTPDSTKDIGTAWAERGAAALLKVPSVLVPVEYNFILNPAHPDFGRLAVRNPEPFSLDPRMWK
jgi:RES domain-containing protein